MVQEVVESFLSYVEMTAQVVTLCLLQMQSECQIIQALKCVCWKASDTLTEII